MRTLPARPWLAVVLVLVLFLAGIGRGPSAVVADLPFAPVIAGIVVPICHDEAGGKGGSDSPGHHDCCDTCALCAPVLLPDRPDHLAPSRILHRVVHAVVRHAEPILSRPRTPRLAQGPPARAT